MIAQYHMKRMGLRLTRN